MGVISRISRAFKGFFREFRATSVPINSDSFLNAFGWNKGLSGANVTRDTILSIPPAFSAIRHISEYIAAMDWGIFGQQSDGDVIQDYTHDVGNFLSGRVSPNYTYFDAMQALVANALLGGGGALIIRDPATMRPTRMEIIPRELFSIQYDRNNELYYLITGSVGNIAYTIAVPQQDFIHVKGLTFDGINGQSITITHKETFAAGISAQEYTSSIYGNSAFIGGIVEYPNGLSATDRRKMEERITENYAGSAKAGGVMVLDAGAKFNKSQLSPIESGVIDFSKLNTTQVSQIFKIPLHKLSNLDRSNFSNIEQQNFDYIKDCITPMCVKIQQELSSKLFYEREKRNKRKFFRFDLEGALMGDMASQATFFSSMVQNGLMTPNEARKKLKLNKMDGGDTLFIQQNMAPMNDLADLLMAKTGNQNATGTNSNDNGTPQGQSGD